MSKREYSIREKEIITKLNKVNGVLASRNIKINYSVYNYNGIASKLEKSDLYGADVSNAVFVRVHSYDSKYTTDNVVNSYNLKNSVEIEESFNAKISDIENAEIEDLIEYFGNMANHEVRGFGNKKEYQITYKGVDNQGQNVEIKAWYGNKNKYKIRKSMVKIGVDGTIEKFYTDRAINFDEEKNEYCEKVLAQGVESQNPESYSLVAQEVDAVGKNKFKVSCVGNGNVNYQAVSDDVDFQKIDSVNYTGKFTNYYEYKGKIEKASGKLACRIDLQNNKVVKPDFSKVKNIVDANKVCDNYFNTYKFSPKVKIDDRANKIIIEGNKKALYKLNFNQVEETVKANFEQYLKRGYVIETVTTGTIKKYKTKNK